MKLIPLPPMTFDGALEEIAGRAHRWDASTDWPFIDLSQLAACGAFRWAVPREFGGDELPTLELHLLYERLATASVATALILTQRDAAVSLIDANVNAPKRANMLRRLGKGELWMTVGIAQLTTSRQGGKPALRAKRVDGGYRLDGLIPWCTGVHQAQFVVAGATLDDGQQVLFLMPRDLMGVEMGRPMIMVALTQTLTSSLRLKNVLLEDRWVLRPPSASALAGRRGLTLGQTFIATGLCQAALDLIAKHTSDAARSAHGRFAEQLAAVRTEVHALCQPGREADATAANARLRGTCNDLALRVTHAAVAIYKGTALLADHPAQRLAREAMFLLVWSCPNPVIDCTVDLLANP
jgi:alkylation response protein AidB-like acyl-CoA dehydrogenase